MILLNCILSEILITVLIISVNVAPISSASVRLTEPEVKPSERVRVKLLKPKRTKRHDDQQAQHLQIELEREEADTSLLLSLHKNDNLVLSTGVVTWHHSDGNVTMEPLLPVRSNFTVNDTMSDDCFYIGTVSGQQKSLAAVNICGGLRGYIQAGSQGYIVHPEFEDDLEVNLATPHVLEVAQIPAQRNDSDQDASFKHASEESEEANSQTSINQRIRRNAGNATAATASGSFTGDEDIFQWYDVKLDDEMANEDQLADLGWDGHVVGNVWQVDTAAARRRNFKQKGQIVCNGPYCEYFRVKKDDPKWLETALYIDNSVIRFHGKDTVKQYVLTLINIVSAIYGDPTLGANLKFVILRIYFYENISSHPIVEDDSKASLENVNLWNNNVWKDLDKSERHDIAVWLTRLNIGGPSGYAPVSGVCDPERSCSLNRDEGLSSAFILAHELGHILGLSHDGDLGSGNTCSKESNEGSVMASMVAATFSYFHWSSCSAGEYHYHANQWQCMKNKPRSQSNYTFISDKIEYEYSLDDQCRMEFDRGYSYCRSFQISDPCSHLWCTHVSSPQLCKTKKGPPMDGTACGKNKWCVNGYCESTSKNMISRDGLQHNAMAGGWSSWSTWGDCSRTCGGGVSFRTRRCDNPRPAYGGQPCPGKSEEFRLCNIYRCIKPADFRAEQCNSIFNMVTEGNQGERKTWLPYEHENEKYKCKLACYNRMTREHLLTTENVVDGTPCSYDHPSNICIQGKCVKVGCDKILGSPLQEDRCGVCAGDGSKCTEGLHTFTRTVHSNFTKVFLLPKGARGIEVIESSGDNVHLVFLEKRTGELILDTRVLLGDHTVFVAEGTKFSYKRMKGGEYVAGRGPLLGQILIGLAGQDSTEGSIAVKFLTEELQDTLSRRSRYEWQTRGWSQCSKDCGGGTQRLIIRCFDSVTGKRIKGRLCGSKRTRPRTEKRACNEFQCAAQWRTSPWEDCTALCGKSGVQSREVFCVPKELNATDQAWKNMVDPRLCVDPQPEQERECGRVPCTAHWEEVGWTSCSTTCGQGYKSMEYRCSLPGLRACGQLMPRLTAMCEEERNCPTGCQDMSPVCERKELSRYCSIPSFNERCCSTCKSQQTMDNNVLPLDIDMAGLGNYNVVHNVTD